MTNEERAALEAIANDAGRHAEDRNAALRALAEADAPAEEPAEEPAP